MMRLELHGQRGKGKFTVVDDSDVDLRKYKWYLNSNGYAFSNIHGKIEFLARYKTRPDKGMVVDHIDRNTLNNCSENLRVCTQRENLLNRSVNRNNQSGHTGVHWHKPKSRWVAELRVGSQRFTRYAKTLEEAVMIRKNLIEKSKVW